MEGGHATYVPACLDALAEVAAGLGADEDAVRLFAAAARARGEIGIVRVPPEEEHWGAIEARLHEALGDEAYETARAQGAELSTKTHPSGRAGRAARGRARPAAGIRSPRPRSGGRASVAEGPHQPADCRADVHLEETVKTHLSHIFRRLEVHSRAELTARAAERARAGD